MNTQHPEKRIDARFDVLEVHSIFPTIQGEGPFAGQPSIFVRLAGCNLQCPGCDTEYTRNRKLMGTDALMQKLERIRDGDITTLGQWDVLGDTSNGIPLPPNKRWTDLVVITGGEPFRQPYALAKLVLALIDAEFRVQIETNGTLAPPPEFTTDLLHEATCGRLTVVCSPKTGAVHRGVQELLKCGLSAYKYVLSADSVDPNDGLPILALGHPGLRLARPQGARPHEVYLQPYDAGNAAENKRHLAAVLRSCMAYGYRLCLQTHKIVEME